MKEDDDLDFRRLLAEYDDLSGPDAINPKMVGVTLDMQDGHDDYGLQHARLKHGVGEEIIRQVLFEVPDPEEKKPRHDAARTLFWGVTRDGRGCTVVCIDRRAVARRTGILGLVTAFWEDESEWRKR